MTKPRAYSYARFSTPEQRHGNSLERQSRAAQEYADAHGLVLDTSLTLRDEGVSAFKGANFRTGALAEFVSKIDSGEVPRGSFLIVESLDRLSRLDPWAAAGQLDAILTREVSVVTLFDRKVYDATAFREFPTLLMMLVSAQTAHEESEKKSKRILASWASKRRRAAEKGEAMTSMAPGWLTLDQGAYEVIPDRAKTVQRIFKLTLEGVGKGRITKTLNKEGVPTFGRATSWHPSTVQKILENEATTGTFQPHVMKHAEDGTRERVPEGDPIRDYFPPIIDEATFLRARAARAERRIPAGRKGKRLSNLFTGIATCAHCASPMHFDNKGDGYTRLVCSAAKRGAAKHEPNSWRYRLVERFALLALHFSLDMDSVLPRDVEGSHAAQLREIEGELLVAREAAAKTGRGIERMLDFLETSDLTEHRDLAEYHERIALRSKERDEAKDTVDRLEATANAIRVRMAEEAQDREATEGTLQEWASISEGTNSEEAFAIRARLQQLLKRSISHMEMRRGHDGDLTYGDIYVILKDGQSVSMWLDDNEGGEAGMQVQFVRGRHVTDEDWEPPAVEDTALDHHIMKLPEWWPTDASRAKKL